MSADLRKRLETQAAAETERVVVKQMRVICDGLYSVTPRAVIAADAGLSEDEVTDLVAECGTWLGHANKKTKKMATEAVIDLDEAAQATAVSVENDVVRLPIGFERRSEVGEDGKVRRRDVSAALARIVQLKPSDEVLMRFLDRKYPAQVTLSYPMVTTVRFIAGLRDAEGRSRIEELDQVNGDNASLSACLLKAYDMLEVARADGEAGIRALCQAAAGVTVEELPGLLEAARNSNWINPARMGEMAKRIETAIKQIERSDRQTQYALTNVRSACYNFAAQVKRERRLWLFESIADLSVGQVQTICKANGLRVDGDDRALANDIRTSLKDMGFESDTDRLLPLGMRSYAAGLESEFWTALEARANKDNEEYARLRGELNAALADADGADSREVIQADELVA